MRRRNSSGNRFVLATRSIAAGGANYVDFVFDLPSATSNASYRLDFNVLCDTRL
jgi:hypothetical protein